MVATHAQLVHVPVDGVHIEGLLELPPEPQGIVLFAHGSGSSRHSPRNNYVAHVLHDKGIGTLLMDLLTPVEDLDFQTRFDIALLTRRLLAATHWVKRFESTRQLPMGYFGASTGAAAALQAAVALGRDIRAVVSRGGRPDLAGHEALVKIKSPALLLVGGHDPVVIELNREAYARLPATKELSIIPGATHLFEEPGTLEEVARQAAVWFGQYLKS
ncbi:MAG: dienelactone hydrolase family protein [Gammaproteobacteria bacterium]|uniref:dienelactone hydrolase family protein n=1 Tax=Rhodoferax sp. TaxID=50421 RepID=UPI0017BC4E18|nr:dienelactone hydrolase family protein [Rhodoferax sp.]MBU3898554.1 dienelactone hydrolase family protein [Gammaproteobacteria bacterium]MBA3056854.1 alpha/beta hydrolase [Rhodoferax sp.]MBU3997881.1 dienelactone hydrolase family protein [Gammaproteobacteria bacterium]MBU4079329.1 dienelactone hydrolase family protein [Gammaproteobacteria bacterium]MBU4113209.1 dienelactone hydrolase family protein [Gammaproteobacteria bacterium]